ncbi:signal transduction histidine kinase [Saccharothrix australiensis]|uniref:histidine kinase n=2 Tax=Saccharothrix australiensis TaxID=2072 RepID=A0A495W215_9PSEU|nr:signal transduction histidine kinase [Saccharothrix australiensis]
MVLGTLLVPRTGVQTALDAVGYALLVAGAVPLAWRRRFPLAVVWATAATCVAYYGLRYPGIFASAPVLPAVYTLVAAGRRWQGVTAALAFLAALYLVVAIPLGTARPHGGVAWNAGFLAAAVVIGTMVAGHRAYLRVVEQRAVEAERTREEAALRRAGEERLWIAQELHDTITHSMSVINVHAGVAAHLLDRDPDRARAGLVAIKEASRDVLRELRATLGVLRRADDGVPGMDGLPVLVARARRAGLAAELHVRGVPRPVPDAIGLAAHRIVQEALTNVLRHSGASAVTVSVAHRPDAIRLRVRDDGTPPGTTATHGTGLIGMRERALALGGSFSAGAAPGGGFLVEALLPVPTGPHR